MLTFGDWVFLVLIGVILSLAAAAAGVFSSLSIDVKWVQAFASFLAVAVALGLAVEQRLEAETRRVEEQTRKHNAHRANLHFPLSRIFSYSRSCIRTLRHIVLSARRENEYYFAEFPQIEVDQPTADVFRDVAECISSCADEQTSRALATLNQWTQIQMARLEQVIIQKGEAVALVEVLDCICDAACLEAMAGQCLSYARFVRKDIDMDISREMIEQRLYFNSIISEDPRFDELFFYIDRNVDKIKELRKAG